MMRRTTRVISTSLSEQMKKRVSATDKEEPYKGDFGEVISTGSTLLDLAISGDIVRGGGVPFGIMIEIFGPSSSGKTVLLSEMAGAVQRRGGEVLFNDPEARLNQTFSRLFGLELRADQYFQPDTVPEVFQAVREWEKQDDVPQAVFADSLAALSTYTEMESKTGDKMGMRRAKEFSEELRRTCRILKQRNYLMVCSNQIRENLDAGPYGMRYKSPGGESIGFYASLRLRTSRPEKVYEERTVAGKKLRRSVGVNITVDVFKSSISKPYRTAPLTILFDYGIDDIRQNLQYIKDHTSATTYTIGGENIGKAMRDAIQHIEDNELEETLRDEVITLWETVESKFDSKRKPRR